MAALISRSKQLSFALLCVAGSSAAVAQVSQEPAIESELATQAVVSGVSVYDAEHLLKYALAHLGQENRQIDAEAVAIAIEQIYREDGYALAQVRLAYTNEGNPVFQVEEGYLDSISISGLSAPTEKRIRSYSQKLLASKPLMQVDLERALALSSDLGGVALANEIAPSVPGMGSTLKIQGSENKSSGSAGVEIIPLRPGSAVRAFVVQEAYGIATGGDLARLLGQATLDRGDDWSVSGLAYYRAPIGPEGTYIELMGGNTVARRDFANISGESRLSGWNAAFVVGHPVQRNLSNFTYLLAEYEFVDARSRFLGRKLQSTAHALRLRALKGADYSNGSMFRAALTVSGGARPQTAIGLLPDGAKRFGHVRSEIGVSLPLDKHQLTSLRLEFRGQWASARLPEVERIAMGHAPFLRGYAPAEISGDRGLGATAEVTHSIYTNKKSITEIAPFAFAAFGYVDTLRPHSGEPSENKVASIGVGSSFTISNRLRLSGWGALPLRDAPQTRSANPAFHASITVGW